MILNYNRKTFIVQATGVTNIYCFISRVNTALSCVDTVDLTFQFCVAFLQSISLSWSVKSEAVITAFCYLRNT